MSRFYFFALVGAALGAVGDVAGVAAARGWHPRLTLAASLVAWTGCGPAWFGLCRSAQGNFTAAAVAWGMTGALVTALLAVCAGDGQTRVQWVGFALVMAGILVHCLGGRSSP